MVALHCLPCINLQEKLFIHWRMRTTLDLNLKGQGNDDILHSLKHLQPQLQRSMNVKSTVFSNEQPGPVPTNDQERNGIPLLPQDGESRNIKMETLLAVMLRRLRAIIGEE